MAPGRLHLERRNGYEDAAVSEDGDPARPVIYTIGHSNHTMERLIELLRAHAVEVLVDVRSQPYSRYSPHFGKPALEAALVEAGFKYLYMGQELGGRPRGAEFYDQDGRAVYSRVERAPLFQEGIARLEHGIGKYRVAMLCSEENPTGCHRRLLVGSYLTRRQTTLLHIRGDGRVEREDSVVVEDQPDGQLSLFPTEEVYERKSIRSVLPREQRPASSGR